MTRAGRQAWEECVDANKPNQRTYLSEGSSLLKTKFIFRGTDN